MSSPLSADRIAARLAKAPGWELRGDAIVRTYHCGNFEGSMRFVNQVAALANAQDHHPDIAIAWADVTLTLSSHDAGGLTDRDFTLAAAVDLLAPSG